MVSLGRLLGTSWSGLGMSKSSVVRIAMAGACLSAAWLLGRRSQAMANHPPTVVSIPVQPDVGDAADCPCFNLVDLDVTQWSGVVVDDPICKSSPPLWSITSKPTEIVNAASVHTDLNTCVFVVEFGPNADVFRAELRLTPTQTKHCIKIIEAKQAELLCVPSVSDRASSS